MSMQTCRFYSIETGEGKIDVELNCLNEVKAWKALVRVGGGVALMGAPV